MEIKKTTTITPVYTIAGEHWQVLSIYGSALSGDIDMLTVIKDDMEAKGLYVEMEDIDDDNDIVTILRGDSHQEAIKNGVHRWKYYFRSEGSEIEFVREDSTWIAE